MPDNGKTFFAFCRSAAEFDSSYEIFPTYAHLIAIAAAVGLEAKSFEHSPKLLSTQPNPIPLDTFRSQQLDTLLLAIAMAWLKSDEPIADESVFCETVQGLAAGGFEEMKRHYEELGNQRSAFPEFWEWFVLQKAELSE